MKANELMIGDWVMQFGEPRRIVGIRTDAFYPYIKTNMGDTWYEEGMKDLAEPIPLTPEILEENGFISNKFNINDVFGTRFDLGNHYYLIFYNSNKGGSLTKYYTSQSGFYITTIEYVHELQHALRLCGIEKEIEV